MTVKSFASGVYRRANTKAGRSFIVFLLILGLIVGAFFLGDHRGAKRQWKRDEKNIRPGLNRPGSRTSGSNQKHASAIGTVINVDSKNIEVKSTTGKTTKFKIESSTNISGIDGKKTDANALKKDQKVIVTGTVNSDNSNTAQRIHIQK